jgi:hypothetical protein
VALLCHEHVVGRGIVDESGDDLALALQRDGNREMRDAVHEVRRAVDRIDDEAVGLVGAVDRAAFFGEKAVAGAHARQFLDQDALGALVGIGDEIRRSLHRDLQVFELAEVARERAPRLARGGHHHIESGGDVGHQDARRR